MDKATHVFEKISALNFKHILMTYVAPAEREGVRLLSKGIAVIKHPKLKEVQKTQVVDRLAKKFSLDVKETPSFYLLREGTPKKAPGLSFKQESVKVHKEVGYDAYPSDRARLQRYRRAWKQGYDPYYDRLGGD